MFSIAGDIIGLFATFEGLPKDAPNADSFIREPWVLV